MDTGHLEENRIVINPNMMVGKPTIRGMRITVEQILNSLSNGLTEQNLIEEYPELEKEGFQGVYSYAAGLVEEERVFNIEMNA